MVQSASQNKIVVLLMGKSGCGKSTLERNLILQYSDYFKKVISSTTRPIRPGEQDGVDYWFVSEDEYDKIDFIQTTKFAGYRYGSSVSEYLTPQEFPTLCVVPLSARDFTDTLEKRYPTWGTFNIYFDISEERLMANMRKRGDTEEMIEKRISQDTLDEQFNESGLYPHLIVYDEDLNDKFPKEVFIEVKLHEVSHEIHVNARVNWNKVG